MNSVEDQVRAATQAQAQALREVRPLRLAPAPARYVRRPWRSNGARGMRGWLVPVTAAAAVIALAISLVIVRDLPNGRGAPPADQLTAASGVPRYYVALYKPGTSPASSGLVIGDTLTGARLATIAPRSGSRFVGVTGAADDRTFVVSTMAVARHGNPALAVTWYLLRIAPASTPGYRLTKLAIPDMRSWGVQGIALSGSGRYLAMTLVPAEHKAGSPWWVLRIYSVATGKLLRTWSGGDAVTLYLFSILPGLQNQMLSWTGGDRAVAFPAYPISRKSAAGALRESERLIDANAPSGGLLAHSRVIWSAPTTAGAVAPNGCQQASAQVSANGKTVVCASGSVGPVSSGKRPVTLAWLAYSTAAPTVARILYEVTVDAPSSAASLSTVLWSNASGGTLIVEWAIGHKITAADEHFGVVSHGKFHPLPPLPSFADWTTVAW